MTPPGRQGRLDRWWGYWALTTCTTAVLITVVETALLQRKWNYVTGGFLAAEHLSNPWQALGFVAGSLGADGATASVLVAALFATGRYFDVPLRAVVIGTVVMAATPFLATDFVNYSVLSFLGDKFDLQLMFDLVGGDLREFVAVSGGHLGRMAVAAGIVALPLVWLGIAILKRATVGRPVKDVDIVRPRLRVLIGTMAATLLVAATAVAGLRVSSDVVDSGLRRKPSVQVLGLVVARLSDIDGDGYGVLGRIPDPDPFDARVYPYAIDEPGNGIDEDGIGGDLPADSKPYAERQAIAGPWRSRPNLLLVMLESVRADAVGATLGGRSVTPFLDSLGARGAKVAHAYSHNGFTVQSRKHVFSGSLAGVRGSATLIDDFSANGYEVGYFSAQDESFGGPEWQIGFDRADSSFDARSDVQHRYTASTTPGSLALPYPVVLTSVQQFLDTRRTDRPLFLYVNFHDTHYPYRHQGLAQLLSAPILAQGEILPERRVELRAMYLNTLANVDRAIEELVGRLTGHLGAAPAIVVLSDHGESLFDEGFLGHGYSLDDTQTRIPLLADGIPIVFEEPFGEADLRDALADALTAPPDTSAVATVRADPHRELFQYLGNFADPVQIGLRGVHQRTVFDFRTRRVMVDGGPPVRPEDLTPGGQEAFLRLVRLWERMMIARRTDRVRT